MDLKKYLDEKCIEVISLESNRGFKQKNILSTLERYGYKRKDGKDITQPFLSAVLIELGVRRKALSTRSIKEVSNEQKEVEQCLIKFPDPSWKSKIEINQDFISIKQIIKSFPEIEIDIIKKFSKNNNLTIDGLLALASKLGTGKHCEKGLFFLDMAEEINDKFNIIPNKNFHSISYAISISIFYTMRCQLNEKESEIVKIIKENLNEYIPNATLIKKVSNKNNIPDIWVEINKKDIPIEVKTNDFDNKALKQLIRYMVFYNCDKGIAIASNLTCDLPDNVSFINYRNHIQKKVS